MATRTKSTQFAFPMDTGIITNATVTNLAQITLYIPETVISFQSVTVDIGFQDIITATGGTISSHRVGLRLGAAAYNTITMASAITNSGENMGGLIGPWDFTSYFSTNWAGTGMTCDVQVYFNQSTGTTLGMRNTTATITLTYEYDDSVTNQIKTAYIPLDSLVGPLTTTVNSNIGASQVPQLTGVGGMLPESAVVIRDYYFLIEGNESTSATTDFTLSANIDGGTAMVFGTQESGLTSDRYLRWVYKPGVTPSTAASHNFQLWSSLATRCHHLTITLIVTYQFNAAASTTILNSVILPVELASPLGATTANEASRFSRDFFIEEPGAITMQQSAFRINYNAAATPTGLRLRSGSQAYRAYTPYGGTVVGMFSVQQRIDSGGGQGLAMTIARGKNTIVVDGYMTVTTNQITNINGYIIINYHSDKSPLGIGAHSHTVFNSILQWNAALTDRLRVDGVSISIPEANYWTVSSGFIFYQFTQTASEAVTFDVQCLTTEGKGGGYYEIYADAYQGDNERACSIIWMRGRDVFQRYPGDSDPDRIDIRQPRGYRLFTSTTSSNGLMSVYTYHSISVVVTGVISGSSGGMVTIKSYRTDTGELINSTTRVGNGAYSFTWYDDTIPIFTEAYEDASHMGRSTSAIAGVLTLDVALSRVIATASA